MTTLNARANQAWDEYLKTSDYDVWSSDEKAAFIEGWETGYKTARAEIVEPDSRWPGYGVCKAEGRWGQCVFVAGHHEVESWTPHADMFGRTWNDQPGEEPS